MLFRLFLLVFFVFFFHNVVVLPSEIVLDPIGELSTRLNGHFCGFSN